MPRGQDLGRKDCGVDLPGLGGGTLRKMLNFGLSGGRLKQSLLRVGEADTSLFISPSVSYFCLFVFSSFLGPRREPGVVLGTKEAVMSKAVLVPPGAHRLDFNPSCGSVVARQGAGDVRTTTKIWCWFNSQPWGARVGYKQGK